LCSEPNRIGMDMVLAWSYFAQHVGLQNTPMDKIFTEAAKEEFIVSFIALMFLSKGLMIVGRTCPSVNRYRLPWGRMYVSLSAS